MMSLRSKITGDDPENLSSMFDSAFTIVEDVTDTQLETNSTEYQNLLTKGINLLERSTELVNQLQLFSNNEEIEEIATAEIKYMLLPALLGYLTLRKTNQDRPELLRLARLYFKDYVKRLNSYGVVKVRLDETLTDSDDDDCHRIQVHNESLESAAAKRQEKILRYRTLKQIDETLKTMKPNVTSENADEEYKRRYYLTLLKKWVGLIMDEIESVEFEISMLKEMKRPTKTSAKTKPKKPFKPFIITKDALQKQVFGLGYPSRPVMTVDDFVDKKIEEGTWAFDNSAVYSNSLQNWAEDPDRKAQSDEDDDYRKERLADVEDDTEIKRQRAWDEFKDDTKRGSGNRKNMG